MDAIQDIDEFLFRLVNEDFSSEFLDVVMPMITHVEFWLPFYIIGVIAMAVQMGWRSLWVVLFLVAIVAVADQVSAGLIKDWVGRARPCHIFSDINLLVKCGVGKSFPSAHATNNFAAAMFLTKVFPRKWALWFFIAGMVALSRVYIGVHYPIDIFSGAVLGVLIGYGFYLLYGLVVLRRRKNG
ncbi:MAG: phosphatase PAP2 family protein [Candidatus Kapaibacteriales bacterium]